MHCTVCLYRDTDVYIKHDCVYSGIVYRCIDTCLFYHCYVSSRTNLAALITFLEPL